MSRPGVPRLYAAEELVLTLERRIAEQRLSPGDRLGTKAEIRERYGFSGGTVNEAVILLETRGLVEARPGPGGGLFVASSPSRVRLDLLLRELPADPPRSAECLSVCSALESSLCFDAARNCDAVDAADLRKILAAMRESAVETAQVSPSDRILHRRIAELATNSLLRLVYLTALDLAEESTNQETPSTSSVSDGAVDVHEELAEAVISGQPARLSRALVRHDSLHAAPLRSWEPGGRLR